MCRYYYVATTDIVWLISRLVRQQSQIGMSVNITIKPYHGKKYDPQNTVVIVVR